MASVDPPPSTPEEEEEATSSNLLFAFAEALEATPVFVCVFADFWNDFFCRFSSSAAYGSSSAFCAWLVFLVLLLALCPFLRSSSPRCCSWAVMYQKDSYQWPVHGWFCWLRYLRAVFPFIVGRPCVAFPGQVVLARRCATTGAGSGPDSAQRRPWRLHRRSFWTRLWSFRQVSWSRQCKLSGGSAVAAHFSRTSTSLTVALRQIPVVLVRLQSCRTLGGRCPCCALQHPCRGAEAVSHGPDFLSDNRDSPVA